MITGKPNIRILDYQPSLVAQQNTTNLVPRVFALGEKREKPGNEDGTRENVKLDMVYYES